MKKLVTSEQHLKNIHMESWENEPDYGEYLFDEMDKPLKYPCVAVYARQKYTYVYMEDFQILEHEDNLFN